MVSIPLKGKQPLCVFNLEYLIRIQSSEPLHAKRAGLWCFFFSSSIYAPANRNTGFHANKDKQED
jgi:hypothetical protein